MLGIKQKADSPVKNHFPMDERAIFNRIWVSVRNQGTKAKDTVSVSACDVILSTTTIRSNGSLGLHVLETKNSPIVEFGEPKNWHNLTGVARHRTQPCLLR